MRRYDTLPPAEGGFFLADGGLETTLVFHDGIDLPCFAAYPLLAEERGRALLRRYYSRYLELAAAAEAGFILDTPTWRANADWGAELGHDAAALDRFNRDATALARAVAAEAPAGVGPILLNGVIGPRGDGYVAGAAMTVAEAADYHGAQIDSLAAAGVDLVTATTMTNAAEAVGIARAAAAVDVHAVISFTVETDGRLPSGETLADAVERVERETERAPAYFMVNCAHPDHFAEVLGSAGPRVKGLRANASRMSHAELDAAEDLDIGDPHELGALYRALQERHPQLTVFGGCCGTDTRHIGAICHTCAPARAA